MKKIEDCNIIIQAQKTENKIDMIVFFGESKRFKFTFPASLIKSKFKEENFIQALINFFIKGGG